MKRLVTLLLTVVSFAAFGQNQDANPINGIFYNDYQNVRGYGTNVLPRTDHTNLDTLTNVIKGDIRYDTINQVVVYYNGTTWVDLAESGGGTLDQSYDFGGAGAGRTITADAGAVEITSSNTDTAILVSGYSSLSNTDIDDNAMFFGIQPDDEPLTYFAIYQGDDGTLTGVKLDKDGMQQVYNGATGNTAHGGALSDGFKVGASGATYWGKMWLEYDEPSRLKCELVSDALQYAEVAVTPYNVSIIADTHTVNCPMTINTTTGAFSPPILTTTERNVLTPAAGMMIYNSTTSKHQGYDGSIWNDFY